MKKSILKTTLPMTLVAASALVMAANANAMDFKVSGQIDRALSYVNNGKQTDLSSVDNDGSNSRVRFTGVQTMDNGQKAGFVYEIALADHLSDGYDVGANLRRAKYYNTRKIEAYLQGNFGKLSLGKGDGAAYYANTMDLSGTAWLGGGVWYELYSGGLSFNDGTNTLYTIGKSQSPFNAISRQSRIRYDSPSLGGVVLSASLDGGKAIELAARYQATLASGTKIIAGAGYVNTKDLQIATDPVTGNPTVSNPGTLRKKITSASISMLMPNGFNATLSYGTGKTDTIKYSGQYSVSANFTNTQEGYDAKNTFVQVGYISGKSHYAVNYGVTKDLPANGVKSSQIGAAYVYNWNSSVELYASYHVYKLDLPAQMGFGSVNNIKQLYVGTRIKFM